MKREQINGVAYVLVSIEQKLAKNLRWIRGVNESS